MHYQNLHSNAKILTSTENTFTIWSFLSAILGTYVQRPVVSGLDTPCTTDLHSNSFDIYPYLYLPNVTL
ncbi:hypothetical protein LENED_009935 [Lentinula edodes]|uniref:Uncharacterized protein n=1 Tax=Lentinula edodes TaxID=5353 RepID=A0A1Q3EL30_LENED|nr:hypothetical protein LENED_009935 [Lentinula edodes]